MYFCNKKYVKGCSQHFLMDQKGLQQVSLPMSTSLINLQSIKQ